MLKYLSANGDWGESLSTAAAHERLRSTEYHATVASSSSAWPALEDEYLRMQVEDSTKFHPSFFLAHVCPTIWRPIIILVYGPNQMPVGMMFLKERTVCGIRTGIFLGDASLGRLITSEKYAEEQVFEAAISALMKARRVRGLRLLTSTSGYELNAMENVPVPTYLKRDVVPTECHEILKLPPTYDQFLNTLSYKTRRNFRYFRNRSAKADHIFVDNLSFDEFVPAAWKLQAEQTVGGHRAPLERAIEVLRTARRPLLVALKSANGEMLSFVGGWWEGGRASVFMQLNSDKRYPKDSLSLTMRTYLIEYLIANGCTEIVWWSGVVGPIKHYCEPVPTLAICLDNQGLFWRLGRQLLQVTRSHLPRRFHALAHMVILPPAPEGSPRQNPNLQST